MIHVVTRVRLRVRFMCRFRVRVSLRLSVRGSRGLTFMRVRFNVWISFKTRVIVIIMVWDLGRAIVMFLMKY